MILSHSLRRSALPRHANENPVTATPFVSHPYKCPVPQLLSFNILTNARGYGGCLHFPNVPTLRHSDVQTIFHRVFSRAYALFQVPYPVSPVFATLTKTAGCTPNNSHSGTNPGSANSVPSRGFCGMNLQIGLPPAPIRSGHSQSSHHQCYHAEETYY